MADYYPLLSRAVAALAGQPAEARHAIYDRARQALERQLRSFEPALAEDAIVTELDALNATIARIETEQKSTEQQSTEPTPAEQILPEEVPAEGRPAEPAPEAAPEPPPTAPAATELPEEAQDSETVWNSEKVGAPEAASAPEKNREAEKTADLDKTPAAEPPSKPAFQTRPTVADLPKIDPPVTPVLDRVTEEAALQAEFEPISKEPAPEPAEPEAFPAPSIEPEPETTIAPMIRPRMPARDEKARTANRKKLALFSAVAVVVMVIMGAIAFSKRGAPEKMASSNLTVTAPDNQGESGKTEGRLSGSDTPGKPAETTETKPPEPRTTPAAADTPVKQTNSQALVPTVNRAFMVLEVPGAAPNQFEGKASWTFAPDPGLKGQKTLRALIEFPAAPMTIDLSVARNTDATVNASHTIMVFFDSASGSIKELSAIEWRERENQNGALLAGIVVPIQENAFMLGLDKNDAARQRNLDLLRSQKWMVFEFRMANGRRGAVLVEKGAIGEKAVNDALAEWK